MSDSARTPEQLDLFVQSPVVLQHLFFGQAWTIFYELHWRHKGDSTRNDAICRYLNEYFYGRAINSMSRQDTLNCLDWLRKVKGQGAWALIKARGILCLMFNSLEVWKEDGVVGGYDFRSLELPRKNPTFKVPAPKPPRPEIFISPMEFRGWIKAAKKADDWGFVAAFTLGLWFRLSPIDIENLNDDEVDEEAFEVRIRRRHTRTSKNPSGVLQVIELTEKSWAMIARCRRFRKPGEKRICGIHINTRRRFNKIRKIALGMGMRNITLSALRRSAADHLFGKGFSKDAVADGLGHTSDRVLDAHYLSKRRSPYRREITRTLVADFKGT